MRAGAGGVEGLGLPCPDENGDRRSWFVYVVQLPPETSRDDTIGAARVRGRLQPYLPAIHLMSFYRALRPSGRRVPDARTSPAARWPCPSSQSWARAVGQVVEALRGVLGR